MCLLNLARNNVNLKNMSKYKFKKMVKIKMENLAKQHLLKLKKKHSKLDNINFDKIRCQQYLTDSRLSPDESKLLFQLRTRMYPVKINFKNKVKKQGQNFNCKICKIGRDDQKHLLQCLVLKNLVPELKETKVKYEDIFGGINKMVKAVKLLKIVCKARNFFLEMMTDQD